MAAELERVAVYVSSADEARRAEAALRAADPGALDRHAGVLQGRLGREAIAELVHAGLLVDPLDHAPAEPPAALARRPAAAAEHLEALRAQASYVAIGAGGLEVADEPHADGGLTGPTGSGAAAGEHAVSPHPDAALDQAVYHIELRGPITEVQRREFERMGIDLAAFEPPSAYRTFLTREQYAAVRAAPYVAAVTRFRFAETVTPELVEAASGGADAPERSVFDLVLHRIADLETVRAVLAGTPGVEVLDASYLYLRFSAPADPRLLAGIASLPEVRRLAPYAPVELTAEHARRIVGIEAINASPPPPWTGDGEVVAIFDSGVDEAHPDLAGRLDPAPTAIPDAVAHDVVGHGTHVAGIVAGMAPGARIAAIGIVSTESRIVAPPNWADVLQRAVEAGAKVVNLSNGRRAHGEYDFGSLSLDDFVRAHPDVLVVVAAGNDGSAPEGFVGFGSIFSPASAKNVITVGASTTDRTEPKKTWGAFAPTAFPKPPCGDDPMGGDPDVPAAISSRGPTEFSSVKPDLLAPGTYILSARASGIPDSSYWDVFDEHHAYLGGTSMAAPVVAGAAAVVRQYLREAHAVAAPSAALVKALLVAAARPIPARKLPQEVLEKVGFPDFDQGFGRLDLTTVLPHAGAAAGRRVDVVDIPDESPDALNNRPATTAGRQSRTARRYQATVGAGATEPLCVVLTWTDWPSAGVQNNLHLRVSPPADPVVDGNPDLHFGRPDAALPVYASPALGSQRVPTFDKLNNVERVSIPSPAAGPYTIDVVSENTPKPPQGYALCVVGELTAPLQAMD
ncbi:MAG: serine protease AprX [Solirubrobacteraceae bacterium]|nr:serine protease AprX [Solirubrobacteraceae bacterium]